MRLVSDVWLGLGARWEEADFDEHRCSDEHCASPVIPAGTLHLRLPTAEPGSHTRVRLCWECAEKPADPPPVDPFANLLE